ncbi:mycofactocin biosynthesis chaperone MftB [Nocardia sp. NPDC004711]
MIYDYATRQLSFLKTPLLVTVVRELGKQPDARRTLTAAAIPTTEHDRYLAALASLYQSGTIVRRAASEREQEHHEAG